MIARSSEAFAQTAQNEAVFVALRHKNAPQAHAE
jgi:hypothetical protein